MLFLTKVIGNEEASGMKITTDDVFIAYEDGEKIILSKMLPGFISAKTFSVTNNSATSKEYSIVFTNVESTMVGNDFVFTLTSTNGGAEISETVMPIEDTALVISVSIPANITQTYTMTIMYKNMPYPQNENQGATFAGRLELQVLSSEIDCNLCFLFDGANGTITGYKNTCPNCSENVVIPSTINEIAVTKNRRLCISKQRNNQFNNSRRNNRGWKLCF